MKQRTFEIIDLPSLGHRGLDSFSVALIVKAASFAQLLEAFRTVEARVDAGSCFVTLDDVNQCSYTSGHARNSHHLDSDVEYPEVEDAAALAQYDLAQFKAGIERLNSVEREQAWQSVRRTLVTDSSEIDALTRLNEKPDLVLDDLHIVQHLPTNCDADFLANIPNGYFSCDWSPFESHAVVRRITREHGYRFWGIGASMLGLIRVAETSPDALIADLQSLYGQTQATDAWQRLRAVIAASSVLLLGFTEDFAQLAANEQ